MEGKKGPSEEERQQQSDADRAELKIRPINNGWLLKTRHGWDAFYTIDELLVAVKDNLLGKAA